MSGEIRSSSISGNQEVFTVQQSQPDGVDQRNRYKKILFRLGIAEMVCGILSMALAIIALVMSATTVKFILTYPDGSSFVGYFDHTTTRIAQGLWSGSLILTTGVLGVKTRSNPSFCMYNANMVMSITSAIALIPAIIVSAFGAVNYDGQHVGFAGIHCVIAIIGFAAGVLCIVHSAYCCSLVCCGRVNSPGATERGTWPNIPPEPRPMIPYVSGPYMFVHYQAMPGPGHTGIPRVDIQPQYVSHFYPGSQTWEQAHAGL